jgi:hypothetical protein
VRVEGGHAPKLRAVGVPVDVDPDHAAPPGRALPGLGEGAGERSDEQLLAPPPGPGRRPDQGAAALGREVVRALAPRAHPQLAVRVTEPEHELDQALLAPEHELAVEGDVAVR